MTIGQLIECALGKVSAIRGQEADGTPFNEIDGKEIKEELKKLGYHESGKEYLYNGMFGTKMKAMVFIGPTYYQRLKHLVDDKIHSRARGPRQLLTRQPPEGRSRDGGLRFGEMERDCFASGTSVSLSNGLSVYIENMNDRMYEVLGWDEKKDGIVSAKQTNFQRKGLQECIELTYEDGRTHICTEEHPILTSDNRWVHAKDLIINKDRVKTCVDYPSININEELKECNGWKLQAGSILLSTDTYEEYTKTLAFSRIIGMILADGTINKTKTGQMRGYVYLGHEIDVNMFLKDIRLFCTTKSPKMHKNNYHVYIPGAFIESIIQLDGIIIGRRSEQEGKLPSFIVDEKCPKPIIREFLAGIFGGDGHTCVLGMHKGKKDMLTSLSFSQTKNSAYLPSLTKMLEQLKMLFSKFDICNITLQKPKETTYSKKQNDYEHRNYQQNLHLNINELIPFSEKIGFRYCCHKSQRLAAGVSYRKLLLKNAKKTKRGIEIVGKKRNNKIPIPEEYFIQIGAINWFSKNYEVHRDRTSLPTMNLKLVSRKSVGMKEVYDIQVDKVESFLANGIVSHNCMIAHGMGQFLKERMMETSDLYSTYICDTCGFIAQQMLGSPGVYHCPACENTTEISKINLTYAFKLLVQELMSMNIAPRIRVKKDIYEDLV